MSYINNLVKGFVRSAVNQVGRDGGKVVSNKIYGNSHSSPIKIVDGNLSNKDHESGLTLEKEYIWVKSFWGLIICFCIPIFGSLLLFYRAYVNFYKKTITAYKNEKQAVYKSDRRYTNGRKLLGYQNVKIPVKIEIDETQRKRAKIKSYIYIIIALLPLLIYPIILK